MGDDQNGSRVAAGPTLRPQIEPRGEGLCPGENGEPLRVCMGVLPPQLRPHTLAAPPRPPLSQADPRCFTALHNKHCSTPTPRNTHPLHHPPIRSQRTHEHAQDTAWGMHGLSDGNTRRRPSRVSAAEESTDLLMMMPPPPAWTGDRWGSAGGLTRGSPGAIGGPTSEPLNSASVCHLP